LGTVPALALQSYGGEMPLRVFFFSLPFVAMLIAAGIDHVAWSPVKLCATGIVALIAVGGFVFARYGNERFEQVYPDDMAALRFVFSSVPAGSKVFAANAASPLHMGDFRSLDIAVDPLLARPDLADPIAGLRNGGVHTAYILVTRAQVALAEIRSGSPPGWDRILHRALLSSRQATVVFQRGDSVVYRVSINA
jgi:hypothetical protein